MYVDAYKKWRETQGLWEEISFFLLKSLELLGKFNKLLLAFVM